MPGVVMVLYPRNPGGWVWVANHEYLLRRGVHGSQLIGLPPWPKGGWRA